MSGSTDMTSNETLRALGERAGMRRFAPRALGALALFIAGCAGPREEEKPAPAPLAAAPDAGSATPSAPPPPPSTPDAPFRAEKPPAASPGAEFVAPVPAEKVLKDGARLLVVENHAVPLVALDVLIGTGIDGEPAGKAGLASFEARMLQEGTQARSATELADRLDDLAAELEIVPTQENIQLHLDCLSETLPEALELLSDMLLHPAFRKDDIERVRGLLQTALEQKQANPALLARDEMLRIVYGPKSPWGQPLGGTAQTLASITAADLAKFHADYFRPSNAIISVAGDVAAAEVTRLLEEKLAGWKKEPRKKVVVPAVARSSKRSVVLVDKPGASQSQVWAFTTAVAASDPDAVALRVVNHILGGPFSRLDLNLRESKGYSYGVRAQVNLMRTQGLWSAQGGIKASVTAEALAEYENELRGLAAGALKPGELANAKEALLRSLPSTLERDDAVASAMAALAFNGEPLDHYRTFPQALAKVDEAEVARVAAKYDRPDAWSIVIVGPREASEAKLRAMGLGEVQVKSVAAAALEAGKK